MLNALDETLREYPTLFGVIVLGLSSWLGKNVAEHYARKATAAIQRETTAFQDALVRRRDVYRDIALSMRVFLVSEKSSQAARGDFLNAYDSAFLWASEEVISALNEFLALVEVHDGRAITSTPDQRRTAYARTLLAMRKDSGYAESTANYKVVNF